MVDLSVIIAHYNCDRYLMEAVNSVKSALTSASSVTAELIVVDDGSTADSWHSALRSNVYAPHIESLWVRHPENRGQGFCLNYGVQIARGNVIMFLDADDLWIARKVRLQLDALERQSVMVVGHAVNFREYLEEPQKPMPARVVGALAITSAAFRLVGAFREDLGAGMTIEWFDRADRAGLEPRVLDEVVLLRRIHGQNYGIVHRERSKSEYARALALISDRRKGC